MSQLKSWWSNQRWLNRGLLIACVFVAIGFVLALLLWVRPNWGHDFLGGNTVGYLVVVILLTGGALLIILVVYSILRVVVIPMKRSSRVLFDVLFLIVAGFATIMVKRPTNSVHFRLQYLLGRRDFDYAIDLSGENLSGANLKGVNLVDVDLVRANLRGTNLSNANLQGVNLNGADLSGADVRGAHIGVRCPCTDFQLEGARYNDETVWSVLIVNFDPAAEGAIYVPSD